MVTLQGSVTTSVTTTKLTDNVSLALIQPTVIKDMYRITWFIISAHKTNIPKKWNHIITILDKSSCHSSANKQGRFVSNYQYTMVAAESMTGLEEAGRGLLIGRRSANSVREDWRRHKADRGQRRGRNEREGRRENKQRWRSRKYTRRKENKGKVHEAVIYYNTVSYRLVYGIRDYGCSGFIWGGGGVWQTPTCSCGVTLLGASVFSLCSVLPLTFLRASLMSGRLPGPFFLFSLARIDDSLSGNGGISSKTVACGGTEAVRM